VAPIRRYAPLLAHTLRWAPRSAVGSPYTDALKTLM